MNRDELQKAGYGQYKPPLTKESAAALFQKPIKEGGTKLYFIDIYEYNLGQWGVSPPIQYMAEARFYRGEESFEVSFSIRDQDASVENVEAFFAEVYAALKCEPDKHNN